MSDYDSSLPIRTEADGDAVAKICDATITTQQLKVNPNGSIDTNTSLPSGTAVEITDGTDTLAVNPDGSINVSDGGGSLTVDGTVAVSGTVDVSGSTVTIQEPLSIDDNGGSITVDAVDLDIRDLTAASDSVEAHLLDELGNAFTGANPLPVTLTGVAGTVVTDFQTTAAVIKNATATHTYTVTAGKTFTGEELFASGSGKMKVEVSVGGATIFVGFNSTSNPNVRIPLDKAVEAAAGVAVLITITNRDNQAQDLYSTLTGTEA